MTKTLYQEYLRGCLNQAGDAIRAYNSAEKAAVDQQKQLAIKSILKSENLTKNVLYKIMKELLKHL